MVRRLEPALGSSVQRESLRGRDPMLIEEHIATAAYEYLNDWAPRDDDDLISTNLPTDIDGITPRASTSPAAAPSTGNWSIGAGSTSA